MKGSYHFRVKSRKTVQMVLAQFPEELQAGMDVTAGNSVGDAARGNKKEKG